MFLKTMVNRQKMRQRQLLRHWIPGQKVAIHGRCTVNVDLMYILLAPRLKHNHG